MNFYPQFSFKLAILGVSAILVVISYNLHVAIFGTGLSTMCKHSYRCDFMGEFALQM